MSERTVQEPVRSSAVAPPGENARRVDPSCPSTPRRPPGWVVAGLVVVLAFALIFVVRIVIALFVAS